MCYFDAQSNINRTDVNMNSNQRDQKKEEIHLIEKKEMKSKRGKRKKKV